MKSKNELHAIERDLYQLFDMVWAKFYAQIKNKPLFDKTEVDLTEAESFVLDKGPKWLQNIGYYRDLVGNQQQDEPEPGYLVAKIQKLENSVKTLDGRLKEQAKKMDTLRDGINELHERLKTTEEITERLLREDNDRIIGKVKPYEPELPPREKFKRMKQELRDWIEKEPKTEHIQVNFIVNEKANDGRKGIQFIDADESDLFDITIWDWPRIGLVDGAVYAPEELLITGEAGEE